MAETYTKESLQGESRVSLRQIAMKELGLSAREISEMKSEAIISAIMEKQGGGKKDKKADGKADGKGKAREEAKAKPEPQEDEGGDDGEDTGASTKQLDALGKAIDDLSEQIKGLERQQYMLFGLISDIWLNTAGDGKDALEERIGELEKDFENEGN